MKYTLQQALFKQITIQFPTKASAIQYYMREYSCSRAVAYARFNGKSSIIAEHGLELMIKHKISVEALYVNSLLSE